jgi:hypothetical protein
MKEVINKMIVCGATEEDSQSACDHLKKLAVHEYEYLRELIGLVAQEISVVTSEVAKREERIMDLNAQL